MLSYDTRRRLDLALRNEAAADELEALLFGGEINKLYCVDTTSGSDGDGSTAPNGSPATPWATMAKALANVASNDVILVRGDVREQVTAPLGVYGVRIIGAHGGRPRHDGGVRWREPAVAGNLPLLTLREQGWEVCNILMVPETGYSAVKLHRAESATYPDASHAIFRGVKFIGNVAITTAGGIGIEDYGGMHHVLVEDCEFANLVSAIVGTNVSIAAPLRNTIRRNTFSLNTHDIRLNGSGCLVQDNDFLTLYHGTTHPTTVNLAYTAPGTYPNRVTGNRFADAAADVTIAKGYKPSTGDVWRNKVTDTADDIVAVPS